MANGTDPRSFSFADLIPEPLTFKDDAFDGDGHVYDVRTNDMLSVDDVVRMMRMEGRFKSVLARTERAGQPDTEGLDELLQLTDEMFAMLIPALPDERVEAIPFSYKMRFVEWWRKQQPEIDEGEAQQGRQLIQDLSSPDSSDSTDATPASS